MITYKSDAFTNVDSFAESLVKIYIEKFPYDKTKTNPKIYELYKSTNKDLVTSLENRVKLNWKFFHKNG
jgi:hypothetical protein